MSRLAITVNNLSKDYKLGYAAYDTLGGRLGGFLSALLRSGSIRQRFARKIRVLDNISFHVEQGEVLGIIGANGAGKSTLLKVLSQVTAPTAGRITLAGRIASLLEVGTGFHPDLTGKENVYFNGTLLGMKKSEVDAKLDEIIEFAGVSDFIDTPIKKYSSGMKLRLAFAVAAHLDAEILILDEILAVGDASFQQKCITKMHEVAGSGRTVLFVSHNMGAIKKLCNRCIYIKKGKLIAEGPCDTVVQQYLDEYMSAGAVADRGNIEKAIERGPHSSEYTMKLRSVMLADNELELKRTFFSDEDINVGLEFEVLKPVHDLRAIISLVDEDNNRILTSQVTDSLVMEGGTWEKGIYRSTCTIPANLLGSNEYFITVELVNPAIENLMLRKALSFDVQFTGFNKVQTGKYDRAFLRPKLEWKVIQPEKESGTAVPAKGGRQ